MSLDAAKDRFFAIIDRIEELRKYRQFPGISQDEQRELDHLEAIKIQAYTDWKEH